MNIYLRSRITTFARKKNKKSQYLFWLLKIVCVYLPNSNNKKNDQIKTLIQKY